MTRIIVPVFNAADALASCLDALTRTVLPQQPILLVDDASTDPRIAPMLEKFAGDRAGTQVRHQPQNLGFVRTVNAAMAQADEDVVLLNSDTVVTRGWLSALERCAQSDPTIATATPFSNNAEICSIPEFCVNNPPPEDPEAVAAAVSKASGRRYPDLPTGVGFCMLIRRAALEQLGLFDEAYGAGYGEENDFCRRAAQAGWRNVLCDDAYVVHLGGQSFAPLGLKPNGDNLAILVARYPDYEELVARFIRDDPLRPLREAIAAEQAAGQAWQEGGDGVDPPSV